MRKLFLFSAISAALVLSVLSCNKEYSSAALPGPGGEEITLVVDDGEFESSVDTKATAITSVPGTLYWGASTGSVGSDVVKYAPASGSVSAGAIATGKYQTATPTSYNWYVANQSFTIPGSAGAVTMTVANNNTDVICGRQTSSSSSVSIALGHIFARTGSLSASTDEGYDLSGISWKIVGKGTVNGTAGTYSLSAGAWTSASTKLTSQTDFTSSSDLYLIPGTYTVYITYTRSKGADFTETFTKHADVVLEQGKINNISASVTGGSASAITLSVSVTAWSNNNINIDSWTD